MNEPVPKFQKGDYLGCIPTPDDCLWASWHFFLCHFCSKTRLFMIFHQNDPKMIPKRRIIARIGILDPIEFWWVP